MSPLAQHDDDLNAYQQVREFLYSKDWITWIGHVVQGYLVMWIGDSTAIGQGPAFFALSYHGIAREGEGIYDSAAAGATHDLRDGLFDLGSFFLGAALRTLVWSLGG